MFKEIKLTELTINPFTKIGNEWMLITAGSEKTGVNTMTASWGQMGILWEEPVINIYIRPTRYTKKFVDEEKEFSLSFFEGYKKELGFLGTVSGKERNKIEEAKFNTIFLDDVPTFEEAKLIFIVEKIYEETIKPELFKDKKLDKFYPLKDYHTLYIARIKKIYIKE